MATLRELRDERLRKLQTLRDIGVDPYPATSYRNTNNQDIHDKFDELEGKEVTVAGRVISNREHGKLAFIDLKDNTGKIQLYIKADFLQDGDHANSELSFNELNLIDLGDFVEGKGIVTKTQRGEISVETSKLRILTKALRPTPEELSDKEVRLRRRYLDLSVNDNIFQRFLRKSKFWQANRDFLRNQGFIEVETPVLEHVTGGADANPFITHHNDLDQDFYLRISTELFQKRLIGAGYEKIYTLAPNFRNEGLSDEHLQEYYQIEWYWAYANYRDNMNLVRDMMRYVAKEVYGKTKFTTRGHTFDLADEWTEVDYVQVIKDTYGLDIFTATEDELLKAVQSKGIKLPGEINRNRLIDNLWKAIRKTISGPAFLVNEPKFMSPLAKSKPENPELTERFHIILGGSELGNGYSELNDPIDQLERFMEQQSARDSGDDEAQMLDIDFVEMLEYGMPPCSGYAHSERLFWFLEDVPSREGVIFPQLRHEIDDVTKSIYPEIYKKYLKKNTSEEKEDGINYSELYPKAEELLNKQIENENLRRHCHDVEKCMKFYAEKLDKNTDKWGLTGLLHDIDWETNPDTHPNTSVPMLQELGVGEDVIEAILGHGYPNYADTPRNTELAHYLFACDELAGFIIAYSRMKPLDQIDSASVIKKLKDKKFAEKVNRDDIYLGVEEIGLTLEDHVENILNALRS